MGVASGIIQIKKKCDHRTKSGGFYRIPAGLCKYHTYACARARYCIYAYDEDPFEYEMNPPWMNRSAQYDD